MSAAVPTLASRFDLTDRHVAVTGAASGLGLAICQGLLEFGAHVTAIDLDGDALAKASAVFGAPDDRFSLRVADVADHEAIAAVIADSAAELGRLDAAFARAGEPARLGRVLVHDRSGHRPRRRGHVRLLRHAVACRPLTRGSMVDRRN